jgi:D-apionate oxidoisomerase
MRVTILGAGGNMGRRITGPLVGDPNYELRLVEPGIRGRELVEAQGRTVVDQATGLAGADVVVFAVPDKIVPEVAAEIVPLLDSGTSILFLDPAAVAADRVPRRDDIQCFVMQAAPPPPPPPPGGGGGGGPPGDGGGGGGPPLYSLLGESDPRARRDYWGGGLATQAIVFAVAWSDDLHAERVEALSRDMFAPVSAVHRITVDQMALLEPALSETLTNGCLAVIREGMERVVAAGVPEAAAMDFLMGHLQIGIALIFEQLDWRLSEGAQMALDQSRELLFKDDWFRIFEPDSVMKSLKQITGGD